MQGDGEGQGEGEGQGQKEVALLVWVLGQPGRKCSMTQALPG